MRTTTRAGLTTATLIGIVAGPALTLTTPAGAATETVRERGIVLECTGTLQGRPVRADLYQNDTYGNVLAVTIGDPERGGVFSSLDTDRSLWAGRTVKAGLRVDGHRARITGIAQKVGSRRAVHEELDDAGQHVVSDGFHRRLRTDLVLTYAKRTADLTCATAFFYDLDVTKTDIV